MSGIRANLIRIRVVSLSIRRLRRRIYTIYRGCGVKYVIPTYSFCLFICLRPVHRGALSRDVARVGWDAAPAGVAYAAAHSGGGDGAPPGWPLRAACEELADDRYSRRKRGPAPR